MARKFAELRAKMSPDARARAEKRARALAQGMPLRDLRELCDITQTALAQRMDATQPEVSKIEQRNDCHVSTLRSYLEGLGAELDLVARFPDGGEVRVTQFADVAKPVAAR